jgi:hypothetical protein
VHVSSALYCPRCHILERGRANDGIDSGRERRCGVERLSHSTSSLKVKQ